MAANRKLAAWANQDGRVDLQYNPYQQAFLAALDARAPDGGHAYPVLGLFAGRRGGKTKVGAVAIPKLIARKKNQVGWVCAPTYGDLYDYVRPEVLSKIPSDWIKDWSEQHQTLYLTNGTRVHFRSLEDPNMARGPGLDFAWIDEAREVQRKAWHAMMPALADKQGQAFITTSPNGYDWCWEDFWKPAEEGEPGFWACKYKTADNPIMQTSAARAVMARHKKLMDPLFYQQEYEADFVSFHGSIYGGVLGPHLEFPDDESLRTWIPEWPRIDASRELVLGLDPGADHPFAGVLFCVTPYGLVGVGEYLARHRPVIEHVRQLDIMTAALGYPLGKRPTTIAMDRSQRQTLIEFAQQGIYCTPAENAVIAGIMRVTSWLASGALRFAPGRCPQTLKQLQSYRWSEGTTKSGELRDERVLKIDDDLCDAVRYALMTYPELPESFDLVPAEAVLPSEPNPEAWATERMVRANKIERGELDPDEESSELLEDMLWIQGGVEGGGMDEFFT